MPHFLSASGSSQDSGWGGINGMFGGKAVITTSPSPIDVGSTQTAVEPAEVNSQRDIPVRQAVPPRRFVYGSIRIGGVIFLQDNNNPYLYIGIALSDGVIGGIDKVFIGDTEVPCEVSGAASPGSLYYQYFQYERGEGQSSQALATLLSGALDYITSDFRQRGVARAIFRLHWGAGDSSNNALWGDSLTPSVQMRGVQVYDPRDGAQSVSNSATWAYSSNPALCVAHALTHAWGIPLSTDDIDWTSWGACATLCDATVTYGTSVATFILAGAFQAESDLASQITAMLGAFDGVIIDVDGKIGCAMDGAGSSVWTVIDDDILEFGEYAHAGPYENTYNAIKARFFDADDDGTEATTPVYELIYEQATEGLRETSVDLRYSANTWCAQILAFRELHRSRAGRRLTLTLSDAALYLQVLDRVTLQSEAAPFINGDWQVVQVDLVQFGASVQFREYPADAFANPSTYLV